MKNDSGACMGLYQIIIFDNLRLDARAKRGGEFIYIIRSYIFDESCQLRCDQIANNQFNFFSTQF